MPRAVSAARRGSPPDAAPAAAETTATGDVYTMAEAARLKGVSYHTVSRAVRRGKLPAQRLGRMALIEAADLRAWRPMRERAPRKYRRREPNPDATPALLDLASGKRVELARRLSTLYEVLHGAAAELPLPEFLALLGERLATGLDFKRVAVWGADEATGRALLLASFGPPFARVAETMPLAELPFLAGAMEARTATVVEAGDEADDPARAVFAAGALFVAPLRVGERRLGAVVADCAGEPFALNPEQLVLAQAMANQAALALDRARMRAAEAGQVDYPAAIIKHVSDAVFACDVDGRLTVINAAGRALLGLDERPLPPDQDAAAAVAMVRRRGFDGRPIEPAHVPLVRAARGERVRDQQHIVIRPDGTERAVSVTAEPIHDQAGALVGAVAVARDITTERAAGERDDERRAQLEAAAARAAAVADVALAVNAGTDLATVLRTAIGRMVDLLGGSHGAIFFREADGRMTGQVGYHFAGTAAEELELDPVAVPTTMIAFARRAPLFYTYAEAAPSERVYFDLLGFRGAIIAPLVSAEELIGVAYVNYATDARRPTEEELGFAGALASQCAVAIDKTRLMDRMEAAHRRLLAVVDQLPQGVVIVEAADTPAGRLVLANRAAEHLWGGRLSETTGAALGLLDGDGAPFPPGEGPLERTLGTGQGRFGETLTLTRPDGGRVALLANHAPVLDAGGRIVGVVGVFQDVAQLRALDRAKDEFLSVAAHELRNPLTSLHGNLQLLLRRVQSDPARDEERDRLAAIITQSDRLARLVGRLLDVSRAELGRLDLTLGPADAAAIVRRVIDGASGLSADHPVVGVAPDRAPVVWDEVRIEQVLANLVGNAVMHTAGGEVSVTLTEIGDRWRIDVRDHGPGIPDAAKERLFERYYRGAPDGEGADGLGLGLYISRSIARAHGGELTVADAPDGGSRFILTLPTEAPPQAPE